MRTLSILVALGMAAWVAGCASPGRTLDDQIRQDTLVDSDAACHDRIVTLNYIANATIKVHPPHMDVCRGVTITINIVPPVNPVQNPTQSSSANGNPEPSSWLNRTSGDGQTIELVVPEGAPLESTYKYGLSIRGVGSIDPTIRIVR